MGSHTDSFGGLEPGGKYLQKGTLVADRFTIEGFLGPAIVGEYYLATDARGERPVCIHAIGATSLPTPALIERFKAEMRSASQLTHRNITTVFGMGQLSPDAYYIAGEHVQGRTLRAVMIEHASEGQPFSLRGAYSLVAHVCNALQFAHATRIHGSLSPETIMVSDAGRVKVGEFPLSRLFYGVPQLRAAVPERSHAYWAPEIRAGSTVVTGRADVFSVGVLLNELLTGQIPAGPPSRVGALRPDLPAEMDSIVTRCIDPEPANRYKNVSELKEDLASLVERTASLATPDGDAAAAPAEPAGLDIEIDVDRPLTMPPLPGPGFKHAPPPPPVGHQPPPPPRPAPGPGLPDLETARPVNDDHRPSLGPLNLDAIMSSVHDRDTEKWMVTKDKMDHGPFRTREVVQMIVRWEVEGHHLIQDIETGIRCKLRESDQFKDMVERARVEKVKQEEQAALEQSDKAEKRGGVAKALVVLIVIGAIGLIVGSIFAVRAITRSVDEDEADIDELIASGDLKIDMGQGGILQDKESKRGGKRKGGGAGGGGGGTGSYDDYMNQAVNLGDVAGDGGQTQLSQGQVNSVMSSQGKVIYPCIYAELKKDPGLKKVSLKFAIEGSSGAVQGVTVTSGGSSELQSCVASKMKKIKFPKFGAPRMGATFFFNVG